MEIIIRPDYSGLCVEAARIILAEAARKPDFVLGLATGRTPVGVYERLKASPDAFARARFFDLDEFHGRGPSHPESFHRYLHLHFLDHVAHDPGRVRFLRGDAPDLEAEAEAYERAIRAAGGIDLQVLGIGKNGHIGFNEPGSSLASRTRPKTLEPETLAESLQALDAAGPQTGFAITMGIGTILEARGLLLLASGEGKAEIVQRLVEGPIAAEVPASMVQFHPRATVVLDEAAAARLKRRDYYRWVWENKGRLGQTK